MDKIVPVSSTGLNICVFIELPMNPGKLFEEHKRTLREMLPGSYWSNLMLIYHSSTDDKTSIDVAEDLIRKVRNINANKAVSIPILGCSVTRKLLNYNDGYRAFSTFCPGKALLTDCEPLNKPSFTLHLLYSGTKHWIYVPYMPLDKKYIPCYITAVAKNNKKCYMSVLEDFGDHIVLELDKPYKKNTPSTIVYSVYIKSLPYEEISCKVIDTISAAYLAASRFPSDNEEGSIRWLICPDNVVDLSGIKVQSFELAGKPYIVPVTSTNPSSCCCRQDSRLDSRLNQILSLVNCLAIEVATIRDSIAPNEEQRGEIID